MLENNSKEELNVMLDLYKRICGVEIKKDENSDLNTNSDIYLSEISKVKK